MNSFRLLFYKEMTELIRDVRTLFFAVGLPVLLNPLIILALGFVVSLGQSRLKNKELTIAATTPSAKALLTQLEALPHTSFSTLGEAEAEGLLRDKKVALLVSLEDDALRAFESEGQAEVTLRYTRKWDESTEARDRLVPALERLRDETGKRRLLARNVPVELGTPLLLKKQDIDFDKNKGALLAAAALPFMLLMGLFAQALQQASDMTAGEKERGTLETLLVAPVSATQLMLAKLATSTLLIVAASIANLASLAGMLAFGGGLLGGDSIKLTLSMMQTLGMVALVIPASIFAAAVGLAVSAGAQTMKEAQSRVGPAILGLMAPLLAAQMPGLELNLVTSLVPVLNVTLALKASFLGTLTVGPFVLTLVSTLACIGLAVWWASHEFQSERFRVGNVKRAA